ncbi:esterase/lipase family protein [Streptomyces sp. NPDC058145]|uniref:esterase/lipase family protein n=1 Tax=Streptomyces sp. NPDC058145 TaxID=3346356 RepID=UPI0036E18661
MSKPVVNIWGTPPGAQPAAAKVDPWHTKWELRNGTAWVFYSSSRQTNVRRPVILADGFAMGGSNGYALYDGLEKGGYPFISALRENGFDVILLGFNERSASILDNADVAIECIRRTVADREGSAMLTVGGFSMGGLVARYALASMEMQGEDHETSTYLSYDTPHTGAWLPIGVQAFAHFVNQNWGDTNPLLSVYSDLVNSPAARQMLRWHVATGTEATLDVAASQDQERTDFLAALHRVGDWPRRPRLLGVANGTGTGDGNHIPADDTAMAALGPKVNAHLRTQGPGKQTVAQMAEARQAAVSINTIGFPELDGAPGGLFPKAPLLQDAANFGMAAVLAAVVNERQPELAHNTSTFVPTVSAVASADIDDQTALYTKVDRESSDLHDFLCATTNEGHTVMTKELGKWIVAKLKEA